jgi:outer membrane protein TolC
MDKLNKFRTYFFMIPLVIFASLSANSQDKQEAITAVKSDSLSLKSLIAVVINTHPTIKGAEEALKNADARIGLARTGYYPVVDAGANFSNIGPVMKFTIPSMGTFQLYPENNYSASVNFREVIYDFGRTRTNIEIENEGRIIGEKALDQVRQKLALATINNFYTLAFLQHAIKIMDEQLAALQAHLHYVETLRSTGSATDYQVLSTKVKISTAESQKSDLVAALAIQQAYLCSLTGNNDKVPVVREELGTNYPVTTADSLLTFALNNRDEMAVNHEKAVLAGLRYELTKSIDKPVINFVATAGAKNGYLPNLNQLKANYAVGVGISIPIFDGMKTKYNLLQAESAINSLSFENEGTRRSITSEVREAEEYVISAKQKEVQFSLQLEQAQEAYSLAETSFRSGVITNLELLDANTTVSQSMLMLLKARIDYAASIYKLKASLGERLY